MVRLVDEEYDEIPTCLCSAKGCIHVLAAAMPVLHEPKHGIALNDLADSLAGNPVLVVYLFDDRVQPDDPSDLHHF